MSETPRTTSWMQFVLLLLLLLPIILLFLLPGGGYLSHLVGFWFLMLATLALLWWLFGAAQVRPVERRSAVRMVHESEQPAAVREVMDVELAINREGVQQYRGRLLVPPEEAFPRLKAGVGDMVPLVQEDEEFGAAIILLPKPVEEEVLERPSRPTINWVLFGLTLLTTTWAGAAHQGVNLLEEPARFVAGLPYAIGLMSILGVHELGHYFTARHHGLRVTPPYFIPVPFALGTFGAFIQMKSPTEHRTALFDVAVAGPLAGLVIAVPALLIGLQNSTVLTEGMQFEHGQLISHEGTNVGSSLLLAAIAKLALPNALQYGCTVRMSPLAFAGWLGLIVTALNLLPIGQLDGGHIARAMFGSRIGGVIGTIAMWSLFLLAIFVWPALMLWAIIVFFIAGRGTPPLDDVTPISPGRKVLGYVSMAILAAILIPLPAPWMNQLGIYCPYA